MVLVVEVDAWWRSVEGGPPFGNGRFSMDFCAGFLVTALQSSIVPFVEPPILMILSFAR